MKPETKFYRALKRIVSALDEYEESIGEDTKELEDAGVYTIEDHRALLYKHICYKMRMAYFAMFFCGLLKEGVDVETANRFAVLVRGIKDAPTEEQCERIADGSLDGEHLADVVNKRITKAEGLFISYVERRVKEDRKKRDSVVRASQSVFGFYRTMAHLRFMAAQFGWEINNNMREFIANARSAGIWEVDANLIKRTPILELADLVAARENHETYMEDCEFLYETYAGREEHERATKIKEIKQTMKRLDVESEDQEEMARTFDRFAPAVGRHCIPALTERSLERLRKGEKRLERLEHIFRDMRAEVEAQPQYIR